MAKLISAAEGTTLLGMTVAGRARYLRDMKSWFSEGAQINEKLVEAMAFLEIPITSAHDDAIKAKLTPWFQRQPDPANYA